MIAENYSCIHEPLGMDCLKSIVEYTDGVLMSEAYTLLLYTAKEWTAEFAKSLSATALDEYESNDSLHDDDDLCETVLEIIEKCIHKCNGTCARPLQECLGLIDGSSTSVLYTLSCYPCNFATKAQNMAWKNYFLQNVIDYHNAYKFLDACFNIFQFAKFSNKDLKELWAQTKKIADSSAWSAQLLGAIFDYHYPMQQKQRESCLVMFQTKVAIAPDVEYEYEFASCIFTLMARNVQIPNANAWLEAAFTSDTAFHFVMHAPIYKGICKSAYWNATLVKKHFAQFVDLVRPRVADAFSFQDARLVADALALVKKQCTTVEWNELMRTYKKKIGSIVHEHATLFCDTIGSAFCDVQVVW